MTWSRAASEGDLIGYLDYDRRFHMELLSQLGNNRLTESVDRVRRQTRLFGLDQLLESGRLVQSARENHSLIDSMRARDFAGTENLISSHIKHTRGLWVGARRGSDVTACQFVGRAADGSSEREIEHLAV